MIKLLKTSIFLSIITFLIQMFVSNYMSVKTRELNRVNRQITDLQSQISLINQDIYLISSVVNMETKAKTLGFNYMDMPVKNVTTPSIARAF